MHTHKASKQKRSLWLAAIAIQWDAYIALLLTTESCPGLMKEVAEQFHNSITLLNERRTVPAFASPGTRRHAYTYVHSHTHTQPG